MSIEENKAIVLRFFEALLSTDNHAVAAEPLSPPCAGGAKSACKTL
jgi:hypothetical protein